MPRPLLIEARYNQGLAAYRGGLSVKDIFHLSQEIERMHDKALSADEHDEIANSMPSVIAGFADGVLEDLRAAAGSRRGGQRA